MEHCFFMLRNADIEDSEYHFALKSYKFVGLWGWRPIAQQCDKIGNYMCDSQER